MSKISLEQVNVAEPCPAAWDEMQGNATARFCTHCRKHVHDLSAMNRTDAERLLCESAGSLCVRFAKLADGQILTLDYRPNPDKQRWSWKAWTRLSVGVALVMAVVNALLFGNWIVPPPPTTIMMGALPPAPALTGQPTTNPTQCPAPGAK